MTMSFEQTLYAEAAKAGVKVVGDLIADILRRRPAAAPDEDPQPYISRHLTRVLNWASTYNFLGLGSPKDSESETIALRFNTTARRYRGKSVSSHLEVHEDSFLEDKYPIILLGDPGAGKTTTLKRLALTLLSSDATSEADLYQFPILILLRDLSASRFICEEIAQVFGIKYEKVLSKVEMAARNEPPMRRSDYEITIDGAQIEDALADILNSTRSILLIDGLDELETKQRISAENEIRQLSSRLTTSKVVLACRSGDYNTNLEGFRVFEIAPLNWHEIGQISAFWLREQSSDFLRYLRSTPYADIIDRPLLLSFMLYLYSTEGELPEQPSLIYRKVVYRLLKDWDAERNITRSSKYSNFDPDRKIDFLSELSYVLTYELKSKHFSEQSFHGAYEKIHSSFNLPAAEHREVAKELETHTGIIVATGFEQFEFAHLSIQEFLCANYISRSPYPDLLKTYLSDYPAPVAVACALSSNPSLFFVEMINRHLGDKFRNPHDTLYSDGEDAQFTLDLFGTNTAPTLRSFLSRLKIENPYFKEDSRLGGSIFCLFAFYYRRFSNDTDLAMTELLDCHGVHGSLVKYLKENPMPVYQLTDATMMFSIDLWFRNIYEKSTGPWNFPEEKNKGFSFGAIPHKQKSR
jgi:hypothetical protein